MQELYFIDRHRFAKDFNELDITRLPDIYADKAKILPLSSLIQQRHCSQNSFVETPQIPKFP
jgi:hypothetical protein